MDSELEFPQNFNGLQVATGTVITVCLHIALGLSCPKIWPDSYSMLNPQLMLAFTHARNYTRLLFRCPL